MYSPWNFFDRPSLYAKRLLDSRGNDEAALDAAIRWTLLCARWLYGLRLFVWLQDATWRWIKVQYRVKVKPFWARLRRLAERERDRQKAEQEPVDNGSEQA